MCVVGVCVLLTLVGTPAFGGSPAMVHYMWTRIHMHGNQKVKQANQNHHYLLGSFPHNSCA